MWLDVVSDGGAVGTEHFLEHLSYGRFHGKSYSIETSDVCNFVKIPCPANGSIICLS